MGKRYACRFALSTIQVTVRFSSAKFPEGTIDGDTTSISTISAFKLKGRENSPVPALVIKPTRLREGVYWHRASNPGLPVWSPML
ncbi:hypothetical protein TNCV_1466361 [Trichonephila clavipes]|nr:hypothetical protein TNCV_1466361 [Trichonephila clavipes]